MDFIIAIVVFAVSVFLLAVSARYGLIGVRRVDEYFSQKNNSNYQGFEWHYRIPFTIGMIPEYFYAIILGHDNYFSKNWWPLKTASFISILVLIATLKSKSAVYSYFSLDFIQENGILGFFNSGNFVNFMNIIVLLYLALFVLLCIESFKMHGVYAAVRIFVYSILSLVMANLTIITLSLIIFITIVYVVIKIVVFLFFSSKKSKNREEDDEESAGDILSKGFRDFKTDLIEWESSEGSQTLTTNELKVKNKTKLKRPKITRRRKKRKSSTEDEDILRIHPD